jgi:hypothetical protein
LRATLGQTGEFQQTGAELGDFTRGAGFFVGDGGRPGFILTLNQDLFVERHFYYGTRPTLPYIPANHDWFTSNFSSGGLFLGDPSCSSC